MLRVHHMGQSPPMVRAGVVGRRGQEPGAYAARSVNAAQRGVGGFTQMTDSPEQVSKLDTGVPHSARVWNYWLGGKDNFAADRAAGDQVKDAYPDVVEIARASRAFLIRSVRFLAGEVGIRQFLDIGTGLPTADNTHEVAQRIGPESR